MQGATHAELPHYTLSRTLPCRARALTSPPPHPTQRFSVSPRPVWHPRLARVILTAWRSLSLSLSFLPPSLFLTLSHPPLRLLAQQRFSVVLAKLPLSLTSPSPHLWFFCASAPVRRADETRFLSPYHVLFFFHTCETTLSCFSFALSPLPRLSSKKATLPLLYFCILESESIIFPLPPREPLVAILERTLFLPTQLQMAFLSCSRFSSKKMREKRISCCG